MAKLSGAVAALTWLMVAALLATPWPSNILRAAQDTAKEAGPEIAPAIDEAQSTANIQLALAQGQLSYRLLQWLAAHRAGDHNLLVAPGSLACVLSFLAIGADTQMREALAKTTGLPSESALAQLRRLANQLRSAGSGDGPLALANALIFDIDAGVLKDILLRLKDAGMDSQSTTLTANDGVQLVNSWVSERTRGLISNILERPLPRPGLLALSALHFKDRWKIAFDPAHTRSLPFTQVSGNTVELPMMHLEVLEANALRFRQDPRFIAVELPYANDRFIIRLVVVTSKERPLPLAEFAPVSDWLSGGPSGESFQAASAELALPKFAVDSKVELLPALDALGLEPARRSDTALEGFSKTSLDRVGVPQRAAISVEESGTTAAAASAAIAVARSIATDKIIRMRVDKPFMFSLIDAMSGLVLVAGYVANPAGL